MKIIERAYQKVEPHFQKGGRFEKLWPALDAFQTFLTVLPRRTRSGAHIRDNFDSKRMMVTVILALIPPAIVGVYNVGYQRLSAMGQDPLFWPTVGAGLLVFLPIFIVSYAVGLGLEFLMAVIKGHEVSEGYLVSGFLIALIVPPTIPLWQLAIAVVFGVIIGKEIFGGTGMNVFNPALTVRAFLFFAYPAQLSGDAVWVAVDGYTQATALGVAATGTGGTTIVDILTAQGYSWRDLFLGLVPGSIGEVSTAAIILGGFLLVLTGVGSWRVMVSMLAGGALMALGLNAIAPSATSITALPVHYHLVMGGFAFGLVYMATDPVSAASTNTGKLVYGFLAGLLAILIRSLNPAFPEGVMLAILFMNMWAPLIDHVVVRANVRRRLSRAAT